MAQTATLDPAREDAVRADAGREDAEQEEWPTEEQHLRALEHANRVRLARAEIKRRIRAGHLSVVEVIINCPWQVHSMEIIDLLMSQKRWGLARCKRLLNSTGVPENKKIGTLTDRQRVALVSCFSGA